MKKKEILERINKKYTELKMRKHPYTAPELLPNEVQSDQVKALIDVFAEIIEEMSEDDETKELTDSEMEAIREHYEFEIYGIQ